VVSFLAREQFSAKKIDQWGPGLDGRPGSGGSPGGGPAARAALIESGPICFSASFGSGPGAGPVVRHIKKPITARTVTTRPRAAGIGIARFMLERVIPPLAPNLFQVQIEPSCSCGPVVVGRPVLRLAVSHHVCLARHHHGCGGEDLGVPVTL
jgi:hypothetical protein